MALNDSAPEKWEYKEHTRVKHELLRKYLRAWIIKLGKFDRKICYFDGFAGRGEYIDEDKTLGSPIIAMQVADQLLQECKDRKRAPYFDEFVCVNIEKDPNNFNNLQSVIEREKQKLNNPEKIKILSINQEFANVIAETLDEVGARLAPSFFFIDPFGFRGVPFNIVKEILSFAKTEIFFTFMSRDITRFLSSENLESILDELYGVSEWRDIINITDWKKRDQQLKDLYIKCLLENAKVKYAWAFRICMDEKYLTLYYLIHATNHFDGLYIMKNIMYNQGASGTFAYLGPHEVSYRNQLMLFSEDIPSFKNYLLKRFAGSRLTYKEIEEKSYMDTRFIDKHYRQALKELEKEKMISVVRISSKRTGLRDDDIISFPNLKNEREET